MNLELKYSAALVKCFGHVLPNAEVFKHTDILTSGVPDISVTWGGFTTWLEVKIDRGKGIEGRDVQYETLKKLSRLGSAFYVVYSLKPDGTHIVSPLNVTQVGYLTTATFTGCDHFSVVEFVREHHSSRLRRRYPEEVGT